MIRPVATARTGGADVAADATTKAAARIADTAPLMRGADIRNDAGRGRAGRGGMGRRGSAEFGFADGLEVGDAGGVRDGAVEADAGPAAVELEGGEHVVEPGAAGDPPAEPRLGHPGQPGDPGAGHAAGPGGGQLLPAPESFRQRVVDRRADRLVDRAAGAVPGGKSTAAR